MLARMKDASNGAPPVPAINPDAGGINTGGGPNLRERSLVSRLRPATDLARIVHDVNAFAFRSNSRIQRHYRGLSSGSSAKDCDKALIS